jgi:hypothetical protein
MLFARFFLSLLLITILSACGTSGGNTNNEMGGIWVGALTDLDGTRVESTGYISETGTIFFLYETHIYSGNVTTLGNTFTAYGTELYHTGLPQGSLLSGTFHAHSSINSATFHNNQKTADSAYSFKSIYRRNSSLNLISGTYSQTISTNTETYTIDSDGIISGSNSEGCIYSGDIKLIDSRFNMYKLDLSIANCGNKSDKYSGLATLSDTNSESDTLTMIANSTDLFVSINLPRI